MGLTLAIEGGLKEDGLKYPKTLVFCRRYVYECEFMYYCHFSEYKIYPIVERTVAKYLISEGGSGGKVLHFVI